MQTNYFLTKPAAIGFTLIISCFLFSKCGSVSGSGSQQPVNNAIVNKGEFKLCKLVSAKDIMSAISKSKNKDVIMSIYPVKLSENLKTNDFDLAVAFQDAATANKKIQTKFNEKLFETQSGWYAGYLKNKNISRNQIPLGYFLRVNDLFLKESVGISFCLKPGDYNMYYYLLTNNPGKGSSPMSLTKESKDTICKCPPDCCKYFIMKSDSAGKCPPDCIEFKLPHQPIVETAFNKIYSDN